MDGPTELGTDPGGDFPARPQATIRWGRLERLPECDLLLGRIELREVGDCSISARPTCSTGSAAITTRQLTRRSGASARWWSTGSAFCWRHTSTWPGRRTLKRAPGCRSSGPASLARGCWSGPTRCRSIICAGCGESSVKCSGLAQRVAASGREGLPLGGSWPPTADNAYMTNRVSCAFRRKLHISS